jgi:hypothetical protein
MFQRAAMASTVLIQAETLCNATTATMHLMPAWRIVASVTAHAKVVGTKILVMAAIRAMALGFSPSRNLHLTLNRNWNADTKTIIGLIAPPIAPHAPVGVPVTWTASGVGTQSTAPPQAAVQDKKAQ